MATQGTVLILGATGGIGGEVARQLAASGWQVRAMRRSLQSPEVRGGVRWLPGDAMNPADVAAAARGCNVIVHAVNPPGYRRWSELVLPMIDNTIAAAAAEHATVVLPGTVYNFGPDAFSGLTEGSPQHPVTRKGAIRVEMERRLERFSSNGGRVIIVRAGDFFGASARNNWLAQGLVRAGKPVSRIWVPNQRGVGHQWAYLPDVARTIAELLTQRDALPAFARFHMTGHWDADGSQFPQAIRRIVLRRTGRTPVVSAFPWWAVVATSPFVATFREMLEMRYLWRSPVHMTNGALVSALGREPHTPMDQAIERTLEGLGCLAVDRGAPQAGVTA